MQLADLLNNLGSFEFVFFYRALFEFPSKAKEVQTGNILWPTQNKVPGKLFLHMLDMVDDRNSCENISSKIRQKSRIAYSV